MDYKELKIKAKELGIANFGVKKAALEPLVLEAMARKMAHEVKPEGVVGGGTIQPPPEKKKVVLTPDVQPDALVVGAMVQDTITGEKFIIESIDGSKIGRRVNMTVNGVKWYDISQLRRWIK